MKKVFLLFIPLLVITATFGNAQARTTMAKAISAQHATAPGGAMTPGFVVTVNTAKEALPQYNSWTQKDVAAVTQKRQGDRVNMYDVPAIPEASSPQYNSANVNNNDPVASNGNMGQPTQGMTATCMHSDISPQSTNVANGNTMSANMTAANEKSNVHVIIAADVTNYV